jgi:hypothetical protein
VDQRALARAGDARDDHEHAEGDVHVDALQVVGARAADGKDPRGLRTLVLTVARSPGVAP